MNSKGYVLIVDDEQILRESLSEWLKEDGYQVNAVSNGMDALKVIAQSPPDVAVVDIKMPGMDGVTLLKKIKEQNPEIPVIMMTAFATVENAVQSMKDGAYDFLTKPFPPEKLSNMIKHILEHKKLKEENIRLQRERKHILQIAFSALVSFIVLAFVLYFVFR